MAKTVNDLPHNIDAEKAVLGSALISNDAALSVLASLEETDFYLGKHQLIFRAMEYLKNNIVGMQWQKMKIMIKRKKK